MTLTPTLSQGSSLPLEGLRVVEFTHMVMGPTCGMILADLGAEGIKGEPPGGEETPAVAGRRARQGGAAGGTHAPLVAGSRRCFLPPLHPKKEERRPRHRHARGPRDGG